jgi:alkanesulfonate monooxygenase SsuD/methylene tetrahydromethanopterin reductase-like flavin-dependent oxidoreductase (luciferase family)
VAAQNGRQLALGQSVGAFRAIHFGDTEQEAVELLRQTNYAGFNVYFSGFGFWEAFRTAEDEHQYPTRPSYTALPPSEWTLERMRKVQYALAGTPDQVVRQVDDLVHLYGNGGELEWLGWFLDQGFLSRDEMRRQIDMFATHIIPRFKDVGAYGEVMAAASG